jgi:hypothetical protein
MRENKKLSDSNLDTKEAERGHYILHFTALGLNV